MQKLYLTKCVLIGLSTTLIFVSGMDGKRAAVKQEKEINRFINTIAKNNYAQAEAMQQKNNIQWYVSVTSEQNTKKARRKFSSKNA